MEADRETHQLLSDYHSYWPEISPSELRRIREIMGGSPVGNAPVPNSGFNNNSDSTIGSMEELQGQFDEYLEEQNLGGIFNLILKHKAIKFEGLTIKTFNALLHCTDFFRHYPEHQSYLRDLEVMITEIMPNHNLVADHETYSILAGLADNCECPIVADSIMNIPQPNPCHPPIRVITERMREIDAIKDTPLYTAAEISDMELPLEPNPLATDKVGDRFNLRQWLHRLATPTSFRRKDITQQSHLMAALELRLDAGYGFDTAIWNRFLFNFFFLPNEFEPEFVIGLLHQMEEDTDCAPTPRTFQIILDHMNRLNRTDDYKQRLIELISRDELYLKYGDNVLDDPPKEQKVLMKALELQLGRNMAAKQRMKRKSWHMFFERFFHPNRTMQFPDTIFWTFLMRMGGSGSWIWPKRKTFEILWKAITRNPSINPDHRGNIRKILDIFGREYAQITRQRSIFHQDDYNLLLQSETYNELMFEILHNIWIRHKSLQHFIRMISHQNPTDPSIMEFLSHKARA